MGYVLLLIVAVFQLVLTGIILYENRRNKVKQGQIALALASISVFLFSLSTTVLVDTSKINIHNWHLYDLANRFGFLFGTLTLLLFFLFTYYFPKPIPFKLKDKIVFTLSLLFVLLTPFSIIAGKYYVESNNKVTYTGGNLTTLVIAFGLIISTLTVFNIRRSTRRSNDIRVKKQGRVLMFGLAMTAIWGLVFIILIPTIFANGNYNTPFLNNIYLIGYMAPYWFIGASIYSIFRQQLFDIKAIVINLVASTATLVVTGVLFATVIFIIASNALNLRLSRAQEVALVIALTVGALSFQYIRTRIEKLTAKVFYQNRIDVRAVLDRYSQIVVHNIELERLVRESLGLLNDVFKPNMANLYIEKEENIEVYKAAQTQADFSHDDLKYLTDLANKSSNSVYAVEMIENVEIWKRLNDLNIGVIMSLRSGDERLGLIVIGPKQGGAIYTQQDIELLNIIANEMVVGLQNANRFEEIQAFNATLQKKVDDATHKLRKANDRLRALDETKDEFISMASHQLRTPLTTVKGYVSMVLEGDAGKISSNQRKLLDQSYLSAQRMVYLIADLLNVSRLRTGKFVIDSSPTNLANLVEGEIEQLKETAKSRHLELSYSKPKDFPDLMLDETKIRQVVMNFADNAIYYTPAGGHIHINLEDKGETIEFAVVDDGIGVPKTVQHHLFTKFYRADNAKKARPDGTGLGLFMAQKVVVAQGGAIVFKSEEGKGSTFGFSFSKAKLKVPDHLKSDKKAAEHSKEPSLL